MRFSVSGVPIRSPRRVLSLCADQSPDWREVAPRLWESCRAIYVYAMKFGSYQDQLFHTFKVSVRGGIRKPPNAATWARLPVSAAAHGLKFVAGGLRTSEDLRGIACILGDLRCSA